MEAATKQAKKRIYTHTKEKVVRGGPKVNRPVKAKKAGGGSKKVNELI